MYKRQAQGQKRADRQASTGDDSTEQKRMSVEEQVNAGENDKERSQVKTEEQVKKKETAEAQSRVKTEHINEEGAGQPQSRSGQGSKTGASGTDGFGTQENVKPEACLLYTSCLTYPTTLFSCQRTLERRNFPLHH